MTEPQIEALLALTVALQLVTETGLTDQRASHAHPDVVNRFCDAVSSMPGDAYVRIEDMQINTDPAFSSWKPGEPLPPGNSACRRKRQGGFNFKRRTVSDFFRIPFNPELCKLGLTSLARMAHQGEDNDDDILLMPVSAEVESRAKSHPAALDIYRDEYLRLHRELRDKSIQRPERSC